VVQEIEGKEHKSLLLSLERAIVSDAISVTAGEFTVPMQSPDATIRPLSA
jgi:hypothetical protein